MSTEEMLGAIVAWSAFALGLASNPRLRAAVRLLHRSMEELRKEMLRELYKHRRT